MIDALTRRGRDIRTSCAQRKGRWGNSEKAVEAN